MGGSRKHGFLRGNASGRNGTNTPASWHCAGCAKLHGGRVNRTLLAGNDYCDRTYLALKARQFANPWKDSGMNDNDLVPNLLVSPEVSFWLKDALRQALERDPVDAARDAALLVQALDARADALLSGAMGFNHE